MARAVDQWALFDAVGFKPHSGQVPILASPARFQVASCGRRFGKSEVGGHALLPEVFVAYTQQNHLREIGKRREFWVVGPNYCMDADTEVLTERGWLRYDSLTTSDRALTLTKSGIAEWADVTAVNVFPEMPREMVRMKMRGHDSLSTTDHKWLVQYGTNNTGGNGFQILGSRFITSAQLGDKSNERVICGAPVRNLAREPKYTDTLVELVAWYWTEGYFRGPGIEISQSLTANPEACRSIEAALIAEFGSFNRHAESYYVRCDVAETIWRHAPGKGKLLTYEFILSLTPAQLELFIATSVSADGHMRIRGTKGRERVVMQKLKHNLDVLQMACQLAGLQTTLTHNSMNLWFLRIFERNWFAPYSAKRSGKITRETYNGIVWCPTTTNGTWLARRNGTVYFTGNSDSEKEFRVLYNKLKKLEVPFDKPGTYYNPAMGDMRISLWDGTFQVQGKSAAHPDSLVGEGLHGVIIAEAAKIKERVWVKNVQPTLADFKGWAKFTSTPEGKNWFYELWQRGQDPKFESWTSWRRPSWINPYVYPMGADREGLAVLRKMLRKNQAVNEAVAHSLGVDPEVAELAMSMTDAAFEQEIAAEFTDFVGKVFKDFDEETHVGDFTFDPTWSTYAAVDYGWTNPNVWLLIQIDPWGEYINVLGEVYERGLAPDEFADEILRRKLCPSETQAFYPDPASPGDTNVLMRKLKTTAKPGTGGALEYRLDAIRKALKPFKPFIEKDRPRVMFDRSCVHSIADMMSYRYPDTKTESNRNEPELPMKKDDHAPEALGRFFAGHFGTVERTTRRASATRNANFRR